MSVPLARYPHDFVTLVNESGEVIGEENKFIAHAYPLQLHRAPSVWLVNKNGQVLFQQRSEKKIVGALKWGNTICGNVRPNESYEECAYRRLREELGITEAEVVFIYQFLYQAYSSDQYGERELDQVFVGKYDGEVVPNPDEACDYVWIGMEELKEQVEKQPVEEVFLPENLRKTLEWDFDELKKHTPQVTLSFEGRTLPLVPWTWMMLQDERLWTALKSA